LIRFIFTLLSGPRLGEGVFSWLQRTCLCFALFAYEPQDILDIKNFALAPNKQNTFLTPVAAASYTFRQRNAGNAFATITPSFYSDEALAGKGHSFPTTKQRIMQQTDLQMTLDVENFSIGWALAFSMGAVTVSGAGPFTHVFKFLQSTNQMPVNSVLVQDTNDVIYQLPDLAISDLQISGKESGPLSMQVKMTGSGKNVDGAVAFPALATPQFILGNDADILIGPPAPDISTFTFTTVVGGALLLRSEFWKVTWTNAAGETVASAEFTFQVPANSVGKITAPAVFPPGVTGVNVYASATTGTETKQGVIAAAGGNFQEPNTGFIVGAALPTDTTALISYKERVVQWDVSLKMDMQPNRAPGGGFFATFMKVLKQRANLSLQVKATSADDLRTLLISDVLRQVRIKIVSGASQTVTLDFPGTYLVAPAATAAGQEVAWPLTAGDQDAIKWQGQEIFQATVVNNQAAYLVGA
jgi:hypothetical protein